MHLGRASTDPCLMLYIVPERDQATDIHLSALSTWRGLTVLQTTCIMFWTCIHTIGIFANRGRFHVALNTKQATSKTYSSQPNSWLCIKEKII